jgi:glutamate racemase
MNRAKDYAQPLVDIPILQIDAPMAEKAVEIGDKIGLLTTLKTTVPSSSRLIYEKAEERGKQVEVKQVLCNEAYEKLRGGDVEGHDRLLLAEIDRLSESVDVVVMAQLSMAAMEEKVSQCKVAVLTSGRLGFQRAKEMLDALQPSHGRER